MTDITTDVGYSIFEVIPLDDVDLGKYQEYSIVYDAGIEVRYFIIHEIKLIVMHPRLGIDEKTGYPVFEEISISK